MLRDIREEQTRTADRLERLDYRMDKMDRRLEDTTELMTQAMGLAAFSNVRTDGFDDRVAEVEDRMTALENRVRELRR